MLPERLSAHRLVPGNVLSLPLALGTKDARYGGNGCIVPEAGPCLASNSLSPEQMLTLSVNSNVSLQVEDAHSKASRLQSPQELIPRPGLVIDKMLDEKIKREPSCLGTAGASCSRSWTGLQASYCPYPEIKAQSWLITGSFLPWPLTRPVFTRGTHTASVCLA